jgi:hypothetical protein
LNHLPPSPLHEPEEQGATSWSQKVSRHRATNDLALRSFGEHYGLGDVQLGLWEDLRKGHGWVPVDGEVKEEVVPVDQRLRILEYALAVREGGRAESRDRAGDAIGRDEVQHFEVVSDRAGGDSRGRKAEATHDGGVNPTTKKHKQKTGGKDRQTSGRSSKYLSTMHLFYCFIKTVKLISTSLFSLKTGLLKS